MDALDLPPLSPADDTLVQSQVVLFAAALFIGCTIFDVHSARIDVAQLLARPASTSTSAGRPSAPVAKPASTAPAVAAHGEGKRTLFRSASLQGGSLHRGAPACLRTDATPAPLHAWHKARGTTLPAPALLALLD